MVRKDMLLEKLSKVKKECKVCNGLGFHTTYKDGIRYFNDCECIAKISQALKYNDANIPARYLKWDISSLTDRFKEDNKEQHKYLLDYLENIEAEIDEGVGFWLSSTPGLAKSSLISYVVRKAVDAGKCCYFDKASSLHAKLFNALDDPAAKSFLEHIILNVELLVIEEIDKIYLKEDSSFNNRVFFDFLSEVYDSNKALIISSNESKDLTLKRFPLFIQDRLTTLDYLPLRGNYSGRR